MIEIIDHNVLIEGLVNNAMSHFAFGKDSSRHKFRTQVTFIMNELLAAERRAQADAAVKRKLEMKEQILEEMRRGQKVAQPKGPDLTVVARIPNH